MSTHVEALLVRLDKVKSRTHSVNQWTARCPAHDDNGPSLSIKDTGEKVLIHCFAGCDADDVLSAIGLTFKDLYPDDAIKAAQAFGCSGKPKPKIHIDPLAVERRIVDLAESDLRTGKILSMEDKARLDLALERLESAQ